MICLGAAGLTCGCGVVVSASFVVLLVAIVTDVGEELLLAAAGAVGESVRSRPPSSAGLADVFGGAVLVTGGPVTRSSTVGVGCLSATMLTTGCFSSVAVACGAG